MRNHKQQFHTTTPELKSIKDISMQDIEEIMHSKDYSPSGLNEPHPEEAKQIKSDSSNCKSESSHEEAFYSVGNASGVGERLGEDKLIVEQRSVMIQSNRRDTRVSVICQNHFLNSMHKQIIDEHHKQIMHEQLQEQIEYDNWGYFQKLKFQVKRLFKRQDNYSNKYLIDKYVDDYWLIHCPESLSVRQIN